MSVHKGKCSIISCGNFQGSTTATIGTNYFIVPSAATNTGKKWKIALKDVIEKYPGSFVCSLHFHPSDIQMRRMMGKMYVKLKDDAVPSLMLSKDDSPMDVDTAEQDEEVIQYVDVEAIKSGSSTSENLIKRKPSAPIVIQPRLSTENKKNLRSSGSKSGKCDRCKLYELKFRMANGRCRQLEEINQKLNEQIKYLIEKVRIQQPTANQTETTANRTETTTNRTETTANQTKTTANQADDKDVNKTTEEEATTNQDQPNDDNASDFNEDRPSDNVNVECIPPSEEPIQNAPKEKVKKKRKRPPKARGPPKNATLKLDVIPPNSTFFKCGICPGSVSFQTAEQLRYHINETHSKIKQRPISQENKEIILSGKSTFECYICKLSMNKSAIRQHFKQHVLARNKKCDVCNEWCTPKELNWHMCAGEKSIQCEYCAKSFGAIVKLIRHIEAEHETEKIQHKCNKCSRFFGATLLRDLHEIHHKVEEEIHACKLCEKTFGSVKRLTAHLNRHLVQSKDYLCSECGKGFKSASDLKYHGVVHTEKTIKCPDCPLVFLNKTKMRYHRETHMVNKFKCNLCSSILGTRAMLAKHIRHKHQMTEADKKYACTFCSFRFEKSDKLKVHMRSHTGEKLFIS